jgi:hypothetical protein
MLETVVVPPVFQARVALPEILARIREEGGQATPVAAYLHPTPPRLAAWGGPKSSVWLREPLPTLLWIVWIKVATRAINWASASKLRKYDQLRSMLTQPARDHWCREVALRI